MGGKRNHADSAASTKTNFSFIPFTVCLIGLHLMRNVTLFCYNCVCYFNLVQRILLRNLLFIGIAFNLRALKCHA